jgi:hypothetical protein
MKVSGPLPVNRSNDVRSRIRDCLVMTHCYTVTLPPLELFPSRCHHINWSSLARKRAKRNDSQTHSEVPQWPVKLWRCFNIKTTPKSARHLLHSLVGTRTTATVAPAPHVRWPVSSHPHAPRNDIFSFELSPRDLLHRYRDGHLIGRALALHHFERDPLSPFCTYS